MSLRKPVVSTATVISFTCRCCSRASPLRLPLLLGEFGEGTIEGGAVRHTGQVQGLAHLVGGEESLLKVAVGAVAIDFEHHAGDALGEGVVVSAVWVGVGGESLLGDVVGKFCDTDKSALSHRCIPPLGLFYIATPRCNKAFGIGCDVV